MWFCKLYFDGLFVILCKELLYMIEMWLIGDVCGWVVELFV